jgi:hypothetical protein
VPTLKTAAEAEKITAKKDKNKILFICRTPVKIKSNILFPATRGVSLKKIPKLYFCYCREGKQKCCKNLSNQFPVKAAGTGKKRRSALFVHSTVTSRYWPQRS